MKHTKSALVLVDLQNDFCPGGALAVSGGDEIIPLANELQNHFDLIIATQDWHPANHVSFASNNLGKKVGDVIEFDNISQIMWPDHCVQHGKGAEFHPALQTTKISKIFHKGTNAKIDSYSAFFDNEHLQSTGLADYLKVQGVDTIYIMGLATDYCVKYSVLDALHCGFTTYVIIDGCRAVELMPGDADRALQEMVAAGAIVIKRAELL